MAATEIYYFSGTGNSLHVARELQERLPGARLVPILSLVERDPVTARGDTVGFVFPHYASSLPGVVRAVIEKLDLGPAAYLFAIATRGGTRTMAFAEIDEILGRAGRQLDSFFAITMPSGSEPLVKGYAAKITEERMGRLEAEMLARLDTIQRIVLKRESSREEDRGTALPPPLLVPFLPLLDAISPHLVRLGKKVESSFDFYYDAKCSGCGLCERVCLARRVQMAGDRPAWGENAACYGCFACLNYCPEGSVQVKSRWYLKSYTTQNGRYHHPQVTAMDIASQKGRPAA